MLENSNIFYKQLSNGDSLEIEIVRSGLNVYNFDASNGDSYLMPLSAAETKELRAFLDQIGE